MPLPKPRRGENRNDWVSRCMSMDSMQEEFPDNEQRVAVCYSQWRRRHENERMIFISLSTAFTPRTERLEGKEYLVAPATILVEGVHQGSMGRVYYPAEEIAKFVGAWNGVPVPIHHPEEDGTHVSCNDPEILERQTVGRFFNAYFDPDGNRIRGEMWIDVEKARRISPATLEHIRSGREGLELSTALWSDGDGVAGSWNGEAYDETIRNYRPDHVALLPGGEGACSWTDGCGVRANKDEEGGDSLEKDDETKERDGMWAGFKAAVRSMAERLGFRVSEMSHEDLRQKLQEIVDTMDGGGWLHYVREVYPTYFIYAARGREPGGVGESGERLFKRTYTVSEEGEITLGRSTQEVRLKTEYVPVRNEFFASARRPSFSGTETGSWSKPTLGDFDVSANRWEDLSRTERTRVAGHYLIGTAADDFGELKFPVVNPRTGKLNENALRAVIGGRGAQARGISEQERASARRIAYRLLNSEFDADLEIPESLCRADGADDDEVGANDEIKEDENTMTTECKTKERIDALIQNDLTSFEEGDREWLKTLTEEQLVKLEPKEQQAPTANVQDSEKETSAGDPAPEEEKPVTVDDYVKAAPVEIQGVLNRAVANDRKMKDELIKSLVENSRCKFTEEQLRAKDLDELRMLAELANVPVNYEGRTGGLSAAEDADAVPEPPPVFDLSERKAS